MVLQQRQAAGKGHQVTQMGTQGGLELEHLGLLDLARTIRLVAATAQVDLRRASNVEMDVQLGIRRQGIVAPDDKGGLVLGALGDAPGALAAPLGGDGLLEALYSNTGMLRQRRSHTFDQRLGHQRRVLPRGVHKAGHQHDGLSWRHLAPYKVSRQSQQQNGGHGPLHDARREPEALVCIARNVAVKARPANKTSQSNVPLSPQYVAGHCP